MRYFIFIILLAISNPLLADQNNHLFFEKLYSQWTKGFNNKDLKTSCDFFSKDLTANYQGYPAKNYKIICDGFKKIFAEQDKKYHYDFKIKQVYQEHNLAAVRITWFLTVRDKNNKIIDKTTDEGLDILVKNKHGQWQIVNYLGYKARTKP